MFQDGKTELMPAEEEHVEPFVRWFNDPEVTQFITPSFPVSRYAEREWLKRMHDESRREANNVVFVIAAREEATLVPIGTVGLHGIGWKDRDAEVGISIGEKAYWGQRHGSRALGLIVRYAFATLNLHRLHARAYAFNERSLKLQWAAGFVEEGRLREAVWKLGRYHDVVCNGLLRREWEARQK